MKPSFYRRTIALLLIACAVNCIFLLPNASRAGAGYVTVFALSNVERRALQRGNWYRAILAAESRIPLNASVRFVSPAPAWYLAYYFYPRLLKKGSGFLGDRDKVRRQYPGDWVLVYSEDNSPEMTPYPPLNPHG